MKVVQISTVHRATDPRIFDRESRSLAAAGHEVVLLCPHMREETLDGVTIKPLMPGAGRARRMTVGLTRAYFAARAEAPDAYHLHDPELLMLAPFLKRRAKVLFDAHEDLPAQIRTKVWIPVLLRRGVALAAERILPLLLRKVDAVVAATPAINDSVGVVRARVVQNYPRATEVRKEGSFRDRDPSVAYIGGFNRVRGAEELIDALGLLPPGSPVNLAFAGVFEPASLQGKLSARPGWDRVRVAGWLDKENVGELLSRARAGVVTFLPAANHLRSQPNKLFEYMAAGLPVIASDFPLWREIVVTNGCGVCVDPTDPKAIADAIQYVTSNPDEAEEMGERGRSAIERTYNWGTQEKILLDLYEELSCASGS